MSAIYLKFNESLTYLKKFDSSRFVNGLLAWDEAGCSVLLVENRFVVRCFGCMR